MPVLSSVERMSTCHTGAPLYEAARWSQTQQPVLMNEPRAPEVGDEESIDLIPVQQAELWGYNFIYLPCGHWYRFSNLENVFRDKGTCCLCRKCYFPMQVQWVPPQVPNPAAAFQATNQLNEWVQSRLGPPWHIFETLSTCSHNIPSAMWSTETFLTSLWWEGVGRALLATQRSNSGIVHQC